MGQYLFIQKQRYGDKLNYEILGRGDVGRLSASKTGSTTLVENAIYHGIKEMDRPGMITSHFGNQRRTSSSDDLR